MVEGPRTASLVLEDQFTQLSKTGEADNAGRAKAVSNAKPGRGRSRPPHTKRRGVIASGLASY